MAIALRTRLFQRSSPISLRVALAELLVVGLALAEGLVGELEMGQELSVDRRGRAERRCRG